MNNYTKTPVFKESVYNEKVEASHQECLLRDLNDEENEMAKKARKAVFDYLVDFMVISLDENEDVDNENFMVDEESDKLQKELNDIPGLYKKLRVTIGMKECAFLQVSKMNELEKIKIDYGLYPDSFPFLTLRKNLLLLKRYFYNSYFFNFFIFSRGISLISKFIVNLKAFEIFSLIIILLNSLTYSLRNNRSNQYGSYLDYFNWAEDFFIFFYSAEIILKMLAFGIVLSKDSYFRDGWNVLDFLVIIGLYLSYASVKELNLSLLRLLRLLRPLKNASAFKGLRIILYSLFSALPLLFICFCVLNFFYSVFAIGGLQVFSGILKQRCFNQMTGISFSKDDVCGNRRCDFGFICGKMIENPYENVINFDNLFSSFLLTLFTVTLDNWTTIMYSVLRAYSNYAWIYHVTLAIFGNYFLLNLLLAIIKVKFGESHQILSEENKKEKPNENFKQYIDLIDVKKEGLWEGKRCMQLVKFKSPRIFLYFLYILIKNKKFLHLKFKEN